MYLGAAEQGFVQAQYNLGIICGHGWGVSQNYAEAYFWLNIASSHRLEGIDIAKARDQAASHLSSGVLAQTQKRARKWAADHPSKTSPE